MERYHRCLVCCTLPCDVSLRCDPPSPLLPPPPRPPPHTHTPTPPLLLCLYLCLCLNVKFYVWMGVTLLPFDVKVFSLSGSQVLLCLFLFRLWRCSANRPGGKDTTVAVHTESTAQPRKLCISFHKVLMIQPTKQGLYLRITCGKSAVSLLESCMNVISS